MSLIDDDDDPKAIAAGLIIAGLVALGGFLWSIWTRS